MKIYLVGGTVRDELLGLPPKEHDWVVVGATPDDMQALGYLQVGKSFPVFLHPDTKEEYALARTEKKVAPGYTGFAIEASADVTLEQDLQRRDLTINAMARAPSGELIDPFNGLADLRGKVLRHVSAAFVEDPVRVLRVARFAAQYAHLGFSVAEETYVLMQTMVDNGEIDALVPERVWKETQRALETPQPQVFFQVLRTCGALQRLFPEIDRLFGVPQPVEHHPEVDTGLHTMLVLQQAARLSKDSTVRFAALVHDLGKGLTPQEQWPKHLCHEENGVALVQALCERLRVPAQYRDLAVLVTRYHLHYHRAAELTPSTLLKLFRAMDAFRRPQRVEQFVLACEADARGRPGYEDRLYKQGVLLRAAFAAAAEVDTKALAQQGLQGPAFADRLSKLRLHAIANATKAALQAGS